MNTERIIRQSGNDIKYGRELATELFHKARKLGLEGSFHLYERALKPPAPIDSLYYVSDALGILALVESNQPGIIIRQVLPKTKCFPEFQSAAVVDPVEGRFTRDVFTGILLEANYTNREDAATMQIVRDCSKDYRAWEIVEKWFSNGGSEMTAIEFGNLVAVYNNNNLVSVGQTLREVGKRGMETTLTFDPETGQPKVEYQYAFRYPKEKYLLEIGKTVPSLREDSQGTVTLIDVSSSSNDLTFQLEFSKNDGRHDGYYNIAVPKTLPGFLSPPGVVNIEEYVQWMSSNWENVYPILQRRQPILFEVYSLPKFEKTS